MLNIESVRDYCLKKNKVSETFPFDETVLVMKVLNKMFVLTNLEEEFSLTLKAKPEDVMLLTENYENISGAYHMNKKHWINIKPDNLVSEKFLKELIDNSYNLVVAGLTKKQQDLLFNK